MNYRIEFEKAAVKFIKKQDAKTQKKLLQQIGKLPDGNDIKKLKRFDNKSRLRVGGFRVIYVKFDDVYVVNVINIDNCGDVYKISHVAASCG